MKYSIITIAFIVTVFSWLQFRNPDLIGTYDTYWHVQYSSQNVIDYGIKGLVVNPYEYAGFLFQALLSFFSLFLSPLLTSKLVGVIFVGAIFGLVAFILHRLKVAAVWFWLLFLFLAVPQFSVRLLYVRTYLISIVLLLVGLYALISKQRLLLWVSSILYGLSYIAAPILILVSLVSTCINWIYSGKRDFTWAYIAIIGVLIGYILNPGFPGVFGNLIRSALPTIGWLDQLESELKSYSLVDLFTWQFLFLCTWFASLYITLKDGWHKRLNVKALLLQSLAVISFFGMLFAQRFIEYWAPLAVIALAFTYTPFISRLKWKNFVVNLFKFWQVSLATMICILIALFFGLRGLNFISSNATSGGSVMDYKGVGIALQEKTYADQMVFNVNWLEYPKLYFWSPNNKYLIKLGGHVLYFDDPGLYELWSKVANDDVYEMSTNEIYNIIRYRASSRYIIFENKSNQILKLKLMENQQLFVKLYDNGSISLYELKDKH